MELNKCECGGKYKIENITQHQKTQMHTDFDNFVYKCGAKSYTDPITKNYIVFYDVDQDGNRITERIGEQFNEKWIPLNKNTLVNKQ
uniref:Uncharacterized protein n=1 Tax=viral metagenome TaxID=1070528 RepID=A0A6C0IIL4_9ZZZZ